MPRHFDEDAASMPRHCNEDAMTALETELLLFRAVVLIGLYVLIVSVAWIVWRELHSAQRPDRPANAEPAIPRLIVLDGGTSDRPPGAAFAVAGVCAIGRDLDNEIVFQDATISGRHAVLMRRDGAWWLEDLASTNGCMVNGMVLRHRHPALVRSGDVIQVGNVQLRFVDPEAD